MNTAFKKALACITLTLFALPGVSQAQATNTRYPIVLVHGYWGFESNAYLGDYFYGIIPDLRRNGATVFVPVIASVNSTAVRGEQLLTLLKQYQAVYGDAKFNLIGHSHGGPTARYVAGVAPELVASVTTVSSPNDGSPVADAAALTGGPGLAVGGALGALIGLFGGQKGPIDNYASVNSLTTTGMRAFNDRFPAGRPSSGCGSGPAKANGVSYYSAGGTSVLTNPLDLTDPLLAATGVLFLGQPSDGVAGRCSTHWGTVLKDNFRWNHIDSINQIRGLRGIFSENPVSFYRSHVNRLKNEGL